MGELIISKAKDLFFCFGLKSVSMDDVARQAGISKKTLYQSFEDKEELIHTIVVDLIESHRRLIAESRVKAADAVDEVLKQSAAPFETWAAVNPGFFHELEKFFPVSWNKLQDHKQKIFIPGIIRNLERGREEGNYRDDFPVAFVADFRFLQISSALQPRLITDQKMSVKQVKDELTRFYLHGITTGKGKKLLIKYLKKNNENQSNQ